MTRRRARTRTSRLVVIVRPEVIDVDRRLAQRVDGEDDLHEVVVSVVECSAALDVWQPLRSQVPEGPRPETAVVEVRPHVCPEEPFYGRDPGELYT